MDMTHCLVVVLFTVKHVLSLSVFYKLLIRACPPPTVTVGCTMRPPGAQEVRVRTFTHTGGHRHFL